MTLITYPTRVHFADGVLEEALRSELERQGHRSPLLICAADDRDGLQDRLLSGLPRRVRPMICGIQPESPLHDTVKTIATDPKISEIDVIIAFGSSRAIELGRKCRRALSDGRPSRLDFFAIPGIDGLPDPCTRNLESWRMGLPSILICDPTLTYGAGQAESQAAGVTALARCLESYLASAFNPPADGMALDGFLRCIRTIPQLTRDTAPTARRDLMAAGLNAMLSQEKGLGPAQVLARALGQGRDVGAITRLILPGVLAAIVQDGEKTAPLCSMMGVADRLEDGLRLFLAEVPLSTRLGDLGLVQIDLDRAVDAVKGRSDLPPGAARQVLEAVF